MNARSLTREEVVKVFAVMRAISGIEKDDTISQDYALDTLKILLLLLREGVTDEDVEQLQGDYEEFVQRFYADGFEADIKKDAEAIVSSIFAVLKEEPNQ